ncbi:unnamed protein product [Ectocarpus sp. 4 AP-2014]
MTQHFSFSGIDLSILFIKFVFIQISAHSTTAVYSNPWSRRRAPFYPPLVRYFAFDFIMREEFSTLFPLCTHELRLSTRPGAEAREKLTLQEKLHYAGIQSPHLTSGMFRGYQLNRPPGRT